VDYKAEYKKFIKWITDPGNAGLMGPVIYTKEEAAFASLFAAYLNCRYPPDAVLTSAMHSDGEGRCECMQWEDGLIDSSKCKIHSKLCRR